MRRLVGLLAVFILVSLTAGCDKEPATGQGFRFPLSAEPRSLDPQIAADEASRTVIDSLFEGLTRCENGVAVPAAADWSTPDEGGTYVFMLFPSAWSNGDPVTADDFVFAYERLTDPATASPFADALKNVTAVTAGENNTLHVTLATADPDFPLRLTEGIWFPCPRAFFAQCAGGYGMESKALISNGAFRLKTWTHGESLLMAKNDGYHAVADIAPSAVRYVINAEETVDSLAAGKLDGCALTADTDTGEISVTEVADTLHYLWFNNTVSPLTSAAVRRSLRDAVEWDIVNRALPGTPAASYVSPAAILHGGTYASPLAAHSTEVNRSAFYQALTATGHTAFPAQTLLCADDDASLRLAQYIVQSWQKNLAVYCTIEQVESTKLAARLTAGNYQLALASATAPGDTPAEALLLFDGTAADGNWSRFDDADWAQSVRNAKTAEQLAAAEQQLYAACPSVPLAVVTRRFGFAADVTGVQVVPFTTRLDFRAAKR